MYNGYGYNDPSQDWEQLPPAEDWAGYQAPEPPSPPAGTAKKKRGRVVALALVCALLGGALGAGGVAAGMTAKRLADRLAGGGTTTLYTSGREAPVVTVARVDGQTPLSVADVYANNLSSVVGVNGNVKTNYWGQVVSNAVSGSGFVITADGYILTNYHVIDGVQDIKVSFADGSTYDAKLVGGEEANDVAVLKIDATGLRPVVVGSSSRLRVGEQVVAIGNPLGELTFTLTAGYVSALDRSIKMEDGVSINVMQTDAAINSGNSGGPLFNIYGECIGITNAKYSNNGSARASIEGIGFAIPIDDVFTMVTDIIEKGYVSGKPHLGIIMNDVSAQDARRYNLPQGAYIEAVLEGSCADKAGVKEGDIITSINDVTVKTGEELKARLQKSRAGDTVRLGVYRGGETLTLTGVLDENDQAREEAMDRLTQSRQSGSQTPQEKPQQDDKTWSGDDFFSYSWPFGGYWW